MGARFGTAAPALGCLDRRAARSVGARGAARVVEQRVRLERVRLDEHVLRVRARGGERLALRVVREEVARSDSAVTITAQLMRFVFFSSACSSRTSVRVLAAASSL